jgi:O-antigen ligase
LLNSSPLSPQPAPGSGNPNGPIQADSRWLSHRNQLRAFSGLLFLSVALDFSVYAAGLTHLYLHDVTSLLIGVLGVTLAVRNRALLPAGRWFRVPMGLLAFVLANTVVIGAFQYHNVPADMHKLFWLEHGDAIRIAGELLAWVWAFGQLRPSREDTWSILNVAVWGSAVAVGWTVVYSIATNAAHATTSTFDVDILTGLPLAVVFVVRRRPRALDLLRLVVVAAGSAILYSRATIVTVLFTTIAVLIVVRERHRLGGAIGAITAGYVIVFLVPVLLFGSNALTGMFLLRFASIGDTQLAPYTVPNRVAIWKDALHIARSSPVLGVGYHDYFLYSSVTEVKLGAQAEPNDLFSSRIKSAHNDYLSWLSETGVIGIAVFLGFWGSALLLALRFWRREPGERILHTFTVALILSFLGISALGEVLIPRTPDAVPQAAIWWIVLGRLFVEAGRKNVPGTTSP